MSLPGITVHNDIGRADALPERWSEDSRPTAIRITGGVGDALIVAQVLLHSQRHYHIYVRDQQIPLISSLPGSVWVAPSTKLNQPGIRRNYGGIFNCPRLFASAKQLTSEDYYTRAADYLEVQLPRSPIRRFNAKENKYSRVGKYICIHAGSSNPNRRIPEGVWEAVANAVIADGYHVYWMGTFGDFGVKSKGMSIAWDISNELVDQMELVRGCTKFYGNDSGFAHIAGILGVRGDVFFINTHPDQVISRYPNLNGHHIFGSGEKPSRSLSVEDPQAQQVLKRWTAENVCKRLHIHPVSFEMGQKTTTSILCTLRVPDEVIASLVDGKYAPKLITSFEQTEAYLDYTDKLFLQVGDKQIQVSTEPHDLIRALREIPRD